MNTEEALRLIELFEKADHWANMFNLSQLGAFILEHPEVIGKKRTARQDADAEYRERTKK